jgi:hypothetical protein
MVGKNADLGDEELASLRDAHGNALADKLDFRASAQVADGCVGMSKPLFC